MGRDVLPCSPGCRINFLKKSHSPTMDARRIHLRVYTRRERWQKKEEEEGAEKSSLLACLSFPFDATTRPPRRNKRRNIFGWKPLRHGPAGMPKTPSKYRALLFISGSRRCLGKHGQTPLDRDPTVPTWRFPFFFPLRNILPPFFPSFFLSFGNLNLRFF